MTKTNTKSHRVPVYRRPIFIVFIILVIAAIVVAIVLNKKSDDKTPTPADPSPSLPIISPDPSSDQQPSDEPPEEPERPSQFEGSAPNTSESLSGRIAYRGVDNSRGALVITASIDQYLNNGGNCHLALSRANAEVYSRDLSASPDVTTSVCGPFEVPLAQLSSGTYNITIKITSGDKTGIITGEVEI